MKISSSRFPLRILAPVWAGMLFLVLLALALYVRVKVDQEGIFGFIGGAMEAGGPVKGFALSYATRVLLPVYFVASLVTFGLTWAWGSLWDPEWRVRWTGKQAFLLTLAALLGMHTLLWWQVPTALAALPGLRLIPFWILLPGLTAVSVALPAWLVFRRVLTPYRKAATVVGWLGLWALLPLLPGWTGGLKAEARGGDAPCAFLMVGLDGLRQDTFHENRAGFRGRTYPNAYTPIPATRLLYHILWGGDPLYYTVGHAPPSLEEFQGGGRLKLLEMAAKAGWKPRFYIDDGGTIGLAGRQVAFDDVLMPAKGWENFVNSNLAVGFPLYAAWENVFKPFPTTNPWAPLDAGLREALRLGRGSRWVMFHSCLVHQPIYLKWHELKAIPGWARLSPVRYLPPASLEDASNHPHAPDPRCDPFGIYRIRMGAVLDSWRPLWNALAQDPTYAMATRVLFSDHGERFYDLPNGGRLQGAHGFNLDPFESRVAFQMDGPGFKAQADGTVDPATVSLLGLRDAVLHQLLTGQAPDATWLAAQHPKAPLRYHTLDTAMFEKPEAAYRVADLLELAMSTSIAPDGLWFTQYSQPLSERAKHVSVAFGVGSRLTVYRPLKEGGAHEIIYEGLKRVSLKAIDQTTYERRKAEAEAALVRVAE